MEVELEAFKNTILIMFGLIGRVLTHSFSPAYFKEKFKLLQLNEEYNAFPLAKIENLNELLLKYDDISGLNVTIPYKESILPFLDELDEVAAAVGAVNCVKIIHNQNLKDRHQRENKKLIGYNTDVIGFTQSLLPFLENHHHQKALILGTGGASKAIAYSLSQLKIEYQKVSRTPFQGMLAYSDLNESIFKDYSLIINTTPLGTFPDVSHFPQLPYHLLNEQHLLYDLIYNPEETLFLKKGKEQGARIKNGYEMFVLQAEASWSIWQNEQ